MVTGPVSRMQFYRTFECLLIDQAGPLLTQLKAPKPPTRGISCLPSTVSLWYKGGFMA